MPVSTAEVTRRKWTSPFSSTSASTTVAMKLPNDGWTLTPRPTRSGRGAPHPDFSRTRSSAACKRGVLSRWARRNAIESLFALRASSSMKLSMANTLLFGPTPRQKPVLTPGGSSRLNSMRKFGMSYGMSWAEATPSGSTPS
jgi:hypothetical protein